MCCCKVGPVGLFSHDDLYSTCPVYLSCGNELKHGRCLRKLPHMYLLALVDGRLTVHMYLVLIYLVWYWLLGQLVALPWLTLLLEHTCVHFSCKWERFDSNEYACRWWPVFLRSYQQMSSFCTRNLSVNLCRACKQYMSTSAYVWEVLRLWNNVE